ncbi:MAG: acetolactate synthase small subunit [Spirochaetales bacterium]|nr:acetolactate synthase small subunit [Spirochaetales bacterium]
MANDTNNKKHTISLYVANKPGVLIRISLVFARRNYNIDSLVVSEAHDPAFSRMNIVASGNAKTLDQILKQLNKLVDVIHARDTTGFETIERELALIKISCTEQNRSEILQVATAFNAETVDLGAKSITFQISGDSSKLDAVNKFFEKYGIIEVVRSGKLLISPGDDPT